MNKRRESTGRTDRRKGKARVTPLREVRERLLADPEVKLHYDEFRIRNEIGAAIAHSRKAKGLTQARVAELAGTKQSVIARLETGRGGVPSLQFLDRVAHALGLELSVRLEHPRAA